MLVTGTNLHYTLVLPRARLDLIDGIPSPKRDSLTIPLGSRSTSARGQLYLPFQFRERCIPRYVGGITTTSAQRPGISPPRLLSALPRGSIPNSTPITAGSSHRDSPPWRAPTARATVVPKPVGRTLVVIDAGHGGPDNGMMARSETPRGSSRRMSTLSRREEARYGAACARRRCHV